MKKYFYIVLAAAAVFASCTKSDLTEDQKFETKDSKPALFSGSIIQPGGLGAATKVSIIGYPDDPNNVYIQWNADDNIYVKKGSNLSLSDWQNETDSKVLSADSDGVEVNFSGETKDWTADQQVYTARYYGTNDEWKNYVLDPETSNTVKIQESYNNEKAIPVLLENMPLYCAASEQDGLINKFQFTSEYAILKINVPNKLQFSDLFVCLDNNDDDVQNVTFKDGSYTNGSKWTLRLETAGELKNVELFKEKELITYFVPIPAKYFKYMRIVAAKGTNGLDMIEVARMTTLDMDNILDEKISLNNIYSFDFLNTMEISKASTIEYSLLSNNNIDYRVNISSSSFSDKTLTFNASDEATAPATIYINAGGKAIQKLVVNAPYSVVVLENDDRITTKEITDKNSPK